MCVLLLLLLKANDFPTSNGYKLYTAKGRFLLERVICSIKRVHGTCLEYLKPITLFFYIYLFLPRTKCTIRVHTHTHTCAYV